MEVEQNDTILGDGELARRIGAGADPEAEAELFRRMTPRIRLYSLRHLRNEAAAEDLTQQVMITTLETLRAGRLRELEKVASFVLGTCRMTVLDLRRGAQRKERLLEQFGADLLAPVQTAMPSLDHQQLTRYVQTLKERERAVIVMTFYDEQAGPVVAQSPDQAAPQFHTVDLLGYTLPDISSENDPDLRWPTNRALVPILVT